MTDDSQKYRGRDRRKRLGGRRVEDKECAEEMDDMRQEITEIKDDLKSHVRDCTFASTQLRQEVAGLARALSENHAQNVARIDTMAKINSEQLDILTGLAAFKRMTAVVVKIVSFLATLAGALGMVAYFKMVP